MLSIHRRALPGLISPISLLSFAIANLTADEAPVPLHHLRPEWAPGKTYRLQQEIDAKTALPGFGKQTIEWRQLLTIRPQRATNGVTSLDLSLEVIRLDLDCLCGRSRYYFRPGEDDRFADAEGFPQAFFHTIEGLVDQQYRLDWEWERGAVGKPLALHQLAPATGPDSPVAKAHLLPWQALTSVLLHQGIPDEPLAEGAVWEHKQRLEMAPFGALNAALTSRFEGFETREGKRYAVVSFRGTLRGEFHQDASVQSSPGLAVDVSKLRGVTLVDTTAREILSTIIKIDGSMTSLGLPGTEVGDQAEFEKTLTLTLLTVQDAP